MKFKRPASRSEEAFINLTPLIDVVFLLLIFFMVSTTFATIRHGINVELPQTTAAQPKIEETIVISITKEGKVYIGKQWMKSDADLLTALKKGLGTKKDVPVVINADTAAQHGQVVHVMDTAKRAGAGQLGILTMPQQGQR